MWYAKMYFSGEKEFFENDAFGMQGLPSKQLELPFLESLLTFLELDEKEITPMLERISVNWEHFVESSDLGAHTAAMVELGMLAALAASRHTSPASIVFGDGCEIFKVQSNFPLTSCLCGVRL